MTWSSCGLLTTLSAGSSTKADAEQFLADLRERFAKFGLELHPEKTRLIEFGRYAAQQRAGPRRSGNRRRSTFSASRTSAGRPGRAVLAQAHHDLEADAGQAAEVKDQLKRRRHLPIPEQGQMAWQAWCEVTSPTTPCPATPTRCGPSGTR